MTNAGNPAISNPGDCVYTVCRAWRETGKSRVKETDGKKDGTSAPAPSFSRLGMTTMASNVLVCPWPAAWGADRAQGTLSEQVAREDFERRAELVRRCLTGDGGAWEQLVRSHTRLVYATCYRFTGRAEDSSDLTQEVFLRVYRGLDSYDPRAGSFRTWLLRLTRNLLIDDYRKNRKHKVLESIEDHPPTLRETTVSGGRAGHLLAAREAGEVLRLALGRMKLELREAVILRDLHEMEYQEIAGVLRIPQGTVKSRIHRGRRDLAKHLRALGVAP